MEKIDHIPVLLNEVINAVPEQTKIVVDGTLGYWGHSKAILEKFPQIKEQYGFDIDPNIFSKTIKKFENEKNFQGYNQSYTTIPQVFAQNNKKIDFVLLDLGVNMEHFKDISRGFSIQGNEKLDMRFDTKNNPLTAEYILNTYNEGELSTIFQIYADFNEKKSNEIARNIINYRLKKTITHTQDLKDILSKTGLGFKASIVIFQAIRIEVNQEMENVKKVLKEIPEVLAKNGVFAIITFHSIEDRIVKYAFKERASTAEFELVNKKAIQPHYTEIQKNRASRSAKLRLLRKI